ncbi:peptide chain release factor N(5)-glutamine methyltransferase [Benzoatithermus flavus]|uniref:Release factor glutamine methyltransferase n=1 Tax=Benzoatithermus flavus TaxID=3108223 RepID=A0ABU8XLD2_9PROT
MITAGDLLAEGTGALAAAGIGNPRFEARLLLEAATGRSRARLVTEPAEPVPVHETQAFRALLARRATREPMAYILGRAEFWSLPFAVGPGVLVPRADTETLIEAALAAFPDRGRPLRLLDIGVGSGCLLLTLLHLFPNARGLGTDTSETALACTRRNAERLGVDSRLELVETAWAEGVSGPFDLVVSNPPYIPTAEIAGLEPEVSLFEPRAALNGGADGLDAYRAILPDLPRLLAPEGTALLEIGKDQEKVLIPMAEALGFAVTTRCDLADIVRCLRLLRPR